MSFFKVSCFCPFYRCLYHHFPRHLRLSEAVLARLTDMLKSGDAEDANCFFTAVIFIKKNALQIIYLPIGVFLCYFCVLIIKDYKLLLLFV